MATLTSPGVNVSVVNESFYVPSDAGTTPLIIIASGQDKSNGAGLSDPLTLLAESYLLKSLEEQLHYAVPSSTSSSVGGRRLVVDLKKLQGNSGYLAAIGSLDLKTMNK